MFDDVRLHSQGRTFIFPRWLRWGIGKKYAPPATLNRRSPAWRSASRKANGVALSLRRYL